MSIGRGVIGYYQLVELNGCMVPVLRTTKLLLDRCFTLGSGLALIMFCIWLAISAHPFWRV